jgi:hypothetical protein
MKAHIQPRRYFALQVKFLFLFLDKIYTSHRLYGMGREGYVWNFKVSPSYLEAEMLPKFYFVRQVNWLQYLSAFTKIKSTGE